MDYFSQYVTENFTAYVNRKRNDRCMGNHIEMQAMAEMFNRSIEVYQYSTGECRQIGWCQMVLLCCLQPCFKCCCQDNLGLA